MFSSTDKKWYNKYVVNNKKLHVCKRTVTADPKESNVDVDRKLFWVFDWIFHCKFTMSVSKREEKRQMLLEYM